MQQSELIERITAAVEPDTRIRGLFLTGSFGRGTADAFSDVDLLAVAAHTDHEAIAASWRETLSTIAPIVYFNRLPWALILNAITDEWLRCDLQIVAPDKLEGRTQDRMKPLIDRDGIFPALPAILAPRPIDPARLTGIASEFIRILGLLPVVLGRHEVELMAAGGNGHLRRLLTELLILEVNLPDPGGILHLSRVLDPERLGVLAAVPLPELTQDSSIQTSLLLARVFFPRAKALYTALGMEWPGAFETATRNALVRSLPATYAVDW